MVLYAFRDGWRIDQVMEEDGSVEVYECYTFKYTFHLGSGVHLLGE